MISEGYTRFNMIQISATQSTRKNDAQQEIYSDSHFVMVQTCVTLKCNVAYHFHACIYFHLFIYTLIIFYDLRFQYKHLTQRNIFGVLTSKSRWNSDKHLSYFDHGWAAVIQCVKSSKHCQT